MTKVGLLPQDDQGRPRSELVPSRIRRQATAVTQSFYAIVHSANFIAKLKQALSGGAENPVTPGGRAEGVSHQHQSQV